MFNFNPNFFFLYGGSSYLAWVNHGTNETGGVNQLVGFCPNTTDSQNSTVNWNGTVASWVLQYKYTTYNVLTWFASSDKGTAVIQFNTNNWIFKWVAIE